jgi:hypothetical protein
MPIAQGNSLGFLCRRRTGGNQQTEEKTNDQFNM